MPHNMTDTPLPKVEIWTDGCCLGNPGRGGWGALLCFGDVEREISGNAPHSTNNRMEMMAAIEALSALKKPCAVTLYTDSSYLVDGITKSLRVWRARGWKTADRKDVKNVDLWQRLDALNTTHHITWQWVRGHNGNVGNERVDVLARAAASELPKP